jgi:DNA-binding NtrC family response regulator
MRVVLVDNDTTLLRSLEIVLSSRGHKVVSFDDPVSACGFIEKGGPLDILIVDYVMPDLDGKALMQRVGPHLPRSCRVILLSGHTDLVEPLDLASIGINAYLPKPLDLDQLFCLVEQSSDKTKN